MKLVKSEFSATITITVATKAILIGTYAKFSEKLTFLSH